MRFLGQATFIWWVLLSIVSFCTLLPPSSYKPKVKELPKGLCFPLCPASAGEVFPPLLKDSSDDPVTSWPLCKWKREFSPSWKMEDKGLPSQNNGGEGNKSTYKLVFLGTWSPAHTLILLPYWGPDYPVLLQTLRVKQRVSTWERALQLRCKKCPPQMYTLCTVSCEQRRLMKEWKILTDSPPIANTYGKRIWCLSFWTC